jgi:hypothetical protein
MGAKRRWESRKIKSREERKRKRKEPREVLLYLAISA